MAASVDIRYVKFGDTRLGKTMFWMQSSLIFC
jgi:hypothetical protein